MQKSKCIGIVLICTALAIAGISIFVSMHKNDKESVYENSDSSDSKNNLEEDMGVNETLKSKEKVFEIRIPDEYIDLLDLDREAIGKLVEDWTKENQDYGIAVGVEFLEYCEIDVIDHKYQFMMRTLVDEDEYEEASRILMLDYYKDTKEYIIHP